jgi:hypothetical protein
MRFQMYGREYRLDKGDVESGLRDLTPEPIQQLAVYVAGQWWPVKQAYGAAVGKANSEFNSRRAFDILRRLGFKVHDVHRDGALESQTPNAATSHESRVAALEYAVAVSQGSKRPATEVLSDAEAYLEWLTA